ncbi:hypothetical protein [Persephonella sp.]
MFVVKFYIRSAEEDKLFQSLKDEVKKFFRNIEFIDDLDFVDIDENKFYDKEKEEFYRRNKKKKYISEEIKENFYRIKLSQFTHWGFLVKEYENIEKRLKDFVWYMSEKEVCLIIGYRKIKSPDEITDFYDKFAEYIDEKINDIEKIARFVKPSPCLAVEV